jgi:hypothetical protein
MRPYLGGKKKIINHHKKSAGGVAQGEFKPQYWGEKSHRPFLEKNTVWFNQSLWLIFPYCRTFPFPFPQLPTILNNPQGTSSV